MEYTLKALSIYECGQRTDKEGNPHQEDCLYPSLGSINSDKDRFFILCDGMGGHAAGEIASAAVCEAMSKTINAELEKGEKFSEAMLLKAIDAAYNLLNERDTSKDSQKQMGTTMTFLMLHEDGATIAHIGDSRIYHIRPTENEYAKIVRKTIDHSLVNDLLKIGELTPEEAETYPHKNVITRAMQPNLEHRYKADIVTFKNIRPGDYFYMCSDGMLEQTSDKNLCWIFNNDVSDEQKQKMLVDNSSHNKDNHSAHIIHILDVQPESEIEDDPMPSLEKKDVDDGYELVNPEFDESEDIASGIDGGKGELSKKIKNESNDTSTKESVPVSKEAMNLKGDTEDISGAFRRQQGTNYNYKKCKKLMQIIFACIVIALLAICVVFFSKFSEKKAITPSPKEEMQNSNQQKHNENRPPTGQTNVKPGKTEHGSQSSSAITGTDESSNAATTPIDAIQAQESAAQPNSSDTGQPQAPNEQQTNGNGLNHGGSSQLQNIQDAIGGKQTSNDVGTVQSAATKVQKSQESQKPNNK